MYVMIIKGDTLQKKKDQLSKNLFGRTKTEALKEKICVRCGRPVKDTDFRDEPSRKEYQISGLCQKCQDEIWDGGLLSRNLDIQKYITLTRARDKAIILGGENQ